MTATEAYRKTADTLRKGGMSEYAKDHFDIMTGIEMACSDGDYDVSFIDDIYDKMERHMKDLKSDGFRVQHVNQRQLGEYIVSWKHAGFGFNQYRRQHGRKTDS